MRTLDGYQLAKVAEFIKGLNRLTAETGVQFSTVNPYVAVGDQDAGELDWQDNGHGSVEYVLREHYQ